MNNINWNEVPDEVARPVPGGYIAKITRVEDITDKEYLLIEWDFYEGEFKGANKETCDSLGFWPIVMRRSYKQTALRFFKGFKTCVEMSNKNYTFQNDPKTLEGKFVGVVLGEEEYMSNKGTVKTRLYVAEVRTGKAIREGDFKVPELKHLAVNSTTVANAITNTSNNFSVIEEDDDELPF